ncbi:MAG: hypothetical protein IPL01_22720 [Acidobacteria bacterium]|nr:hypothetical protein [Acidobacteriota bacterium]
MFNTRDVERRNADDRRQSGFSGNCRRALRGYSADKGAKLWEVTIGTGVIATPMTYEIDGVQYVSIMAGWGGSFLTGGSIGLPATPGSC